MPMQASALMLGLAQLALQPINSTNAQQADLYELLINSLLTKRVVSAMLPEMSQNDLLPGSSIW